MTTVYQDRTITAPVPTPENQPHFEAAERGAEGMPGALDRLCQRAEDAVRGGYNPEAREVWQEALRIQIGRAHV